MPTPSLDEPTTKIALHVYSRDLAYIRAHEHDSVSKVLRMLLHAHCVRKRRETVDRAMEPFHAQRD